MLRIPVDRRDPICLGRRRIAGDEHTSVFQPHRMRNLRVPENVRSRPRPLLQQNPNQPHGLVTLGIGEHLDPDAGAGRELVHYRTHGRFVERRVKHDAARRRAGVRYADAFLGTATRAEECQDRPRASPDRVPGEGVQHRLLEDNQEVSLPGIASGISRAHDTRARPGAWLRDRLRFARFGDRTAGHDPA